MNGSVFWLYKLRTMFPELPDSDYVETEEANARVTTCGAFLRETKLNQLPQLWNVLWGDMSLVGPRPLSVEETDHLVEEEGFDRDYPGLMPLVRPGLSGLEQCTRSSLDPYEWRFRLNSYYEENISVALDGWIVRKTIFVAPLVCGLVALSTLTIFVLLIRL